MKSVLINNLEFAKKQENTSGEIDVYKHERLADILINGAQYPTKINYTLTGSATKLHFPSLHLTIEAVLPVLCQRCLEGMELNLSLAFDYVISETEPEAFDGDEEIDWLETSREMNLNELIVDELLIAMPLAPLHTQDCKPLTQAHVEKQNPFAVLKDLIK